MIFHNSSVCRSSPARRWCPAAKAKLPESTWNLRKWREQFPPNLKTFVVVFFRCLNCFNMFQWWNRSLIYRRYQKLEADVKAIWTICLAMSCTNCCCPFCFSYSRLIITLIFKERFPLTVQKHIRLNPAKVAKSLSLSIFICLYYNLYMYLSESNCTCIYLPYLESIICLFKI